MTTTEIPVYNTKYIQTQTETLSIPISDTPLYFRSYSENCGWQYARIECVPHKHSFCRTTINVEFTIELNWKFIITTVYIEDNPCYNECFSQINQYTITESDLHYDLCSIISPFHIKNDVMRWWLGNLLISVSEEEFNSNLKKITDNVKS